MGHVEAEGSFSPMSPHDSEACAWPAEQQEERGIEKHRHVGKLSNKFADACKDALLLVLFLSETNAFPHSQNILCAAQVCVPPPNCLFESVRAVAFQRRPPLIVVGPLRTGALFLFNDPTKTKQALH